MRTSMTIVLQSFESCNKSVEPDLLQASITPGISTQKRFHNSYIRQLSHRFQCKRLLLFKMLQATKMTMRQVRLPKGTKIHVKLKTFLKSLTRIFDREKTTIQMGIKRLYSLCHKLEPALLQTPTLSLKQITMHQFQKTLTQKMKMNLRLIKRIKVTKVQRSIQFNKKVGRIHYQPGRGITTTLVTKKSLLWPGHLLRTSSLH